MSSSVDRAKRLTEIAAKVSDYLVRAEALEAKAQKYRERAKGLGEQLAAIAGGSGKPKPAVRDGGRTKRGGTSAFIREWAFNRGADFALGEIRLALDSRKATLGAFYHLVKRGEIRMVKHGRYISTELLPAAGQEDNDHPKIVNLR